MPVAKKLRLKIEEHTGKPFNYIEINHKVQAGSLKTKEDLGEFAGNLLFVTFDDLEAICKTCHSVVTYSQKSGMSEEDSAIEKQALFIVNKAKGNDKLWLTSKGITPASNAKLRRLQIVNKLKEDK